MFHPSYRRTVLQDVNSRDVESRGQIHRLQQQVVDLQQALETANSAADTRLRSTSAHMRMQLDSLTAEHQSVQNSLKSQIASLQQHIDSTTQQLQLAHSALEKEKSARVADAESFRAELAEQQKHAAVAERRVESDANMLKGQEQELQVLHHQVFVSLLSSPCTQALIFVLN
jgi:chromosome segregation ATPase